MTAFMRWLGRAQPDGAAPALEAVATGIPDAILEPATAGQDRRRRAFEPTRQAMLDTVAKQILHGWLQNRHQTLLPLTVNFRVLTDADARLLAETAAAGVLAGSPAGEAECRRAAAFLKASGAAGAVLAAFDAALAAPPPLYRLFERARQGQGLGPLAYILLVVTGDPHDPASAVFLQWAAAKLMLPSTVVRSVERRYRA